MGCVKDEYDDLSDLNSMEMESVKEWEAQFKGRSSWQKLMSKVHAYVFCHYCCPLNNHDYLRIMLIVVIIVVFHHFNINECEFL